MDLWFYRSYFCDLLVFLVSDREDRLLKQLSPVCVFLCDCELDRRWRERFWILEVDSVICEPEFSQLTPFVSPLIMIRLLQRARRSSVCFTRLMSMLL